MVEHELSHLIVIEHTSQRPIGVLSKSISSRCARSIARPASSRPPLGTVANTSSVAGFVTSNVSPETASTHTRIESIIQVSPFAPMRKLSRSSART